MPSDYIFPEDNSSSFDPLLAGRLGKDPEVGGGMLSERLLGEEYAGRRGYGRENL